MKFKAIALFMSTLLLTCSVCCAEDFQELPKDLGGLSKSILSESTAGEFNIDVDAVRSSVSENSLEEVVDSDYSPFYGERERKKLILDMDFSTDVDDVCALRIAANMHKKGVIELVAVSLTVGEPEDLHVKAVHGLAGIENLKIGRPHQYIPEDSPYWSICAEQSDGKYEVDDAVRIWREVISSSDEPVDIVTTGYLTNLADFCKSGADDISDMTGMELLNEKVGSVYIVGGVAPEGLSSNLFFYPQSREATSWIIQNVDKPFFWMTSDQVGKLTCGAKLQAEDVNRDDLVTRCLDAFGATSGRYAWDPMGVYCAIFCNSFEDLPNLDLDYTRFDIGIDIETGYDYIRDNENGKHFRMLLTSKDYQMYNDRLDALLEE